MYRLARAIETAPFPLFHRVNMTSLLLTLLDLGFKGKNPAFWRTPIPRGKHIVSNVLTHLPREDFQISSTQILYTEIMRITKITLNRVHLAENQEDIPLNR